MEAHVGFGIEVRTRVWVRQKTPAWNAKVIWVDTIINWQRTQRRRHYHRNSHMKAHHSSDARLRRKVIWD
jgi:hypothetical protein